MVKDAPHSANCFLVLGSCTVGSTKDMLDSNVPPMTEEAVSKPSTPEPANPPYVLLCSTTFQRSTYIPLHIHTVNRNLPMVMNVLIDTGATGKFIDIEYIQSKEICTYSLPHSIRVYNVDGTPNEAGHIIEALDLVVHYKDHTEWSTFYVTSIGQGAIILGHPWLTEHNPEIDWHTGKVKMTHCPESCGLARPENPPAGSPLASTKWGDLEWISAMSTVSTQ